MYGFAFGFSEFDAEYGELTHTQVLEYGDWTAHSYTLTMHGDHIKTVYITVLDNGMVIYCKVA